MKKIVTTILVLTLASPAIAGDKIKTDSEWLKVKYKQLAAIKEPTTVKNVDLADPHKLSDDLYTYSQKGNGRIVFEDKSWVLLISHSMHADDYLGDLSLIRASDGNYYVNKGHVCGNLILNTKDKITSLETFLKTKGKGRKAESIDWKQYKGEQQFEHVP